MEENFQQATLSSIVAHQLSSECVSRASCCANRYSTMNADKHLAAVKHAVSTLVNARGLCSDFSKLDNYAL